MTCKIPYSGHMINFSKYFFKKTFNPPHDANDIICHFAFNNALCINTVTLNFFSLGFPSQLICYQGPFDKGNHKCNFYHVKYSKLKK